MRLVDEYLNNSFQKAVVAFVSVYLLLIVSTVVFNSLERTSVLSGGLESRLAVSAKGSAALNETKLRLQDFHRVEVRRGKPVWEVHAEEARYFATSSVVLVSNSNLSVYQQDGSKILIDSKGAKLHLREGGLDRAELEGSVRMELGGSFVAETDYAVYRAKEREIRSPGMVSLVGEGYEVSGRGFLMDIDNGEVSLRNEARTVFRQGAELPKSVVKLGEKLN